MSGAGLSWELMNNPTRVGRGKLNQRVTPGGRQTEAGHGAGGGFVSFKPYRHGVKAFTSLWLTDVASSPPPDTQHSYIHSTSQLCWCLHPATPSRSADLVCFASELAFKICTAPAYSWCTCPQMPALVVR
jgi:hypothetical protein